MARKKTYEEVKIEVENKGVTLLSKEYINSLHPLKIRCSCGTIFERDFKAIRVGFGKCSECTEVIRRERGRVFNEDTIDYLMEKYNLTLLTPKKDITKVKTSLRVKCSCGKEFKTDIYNLKKGTSTRCKSCHSSEKWNKDKRTIEEVKHIVSKYGGKLLSTEYKDNKTKLLIECECGTTFRRKLNAIMHYESSRCGLCQEHGKSKGEIKISKILKENNIRFVTQHTYPGLKLKSSLKFDFYLEDLNTCLEYDGEQHYRAVDVFGGEEGFKYTKIRDELKNTYCKDNNIRLIRIPYWEYKNIEKILVENKIIPSQAS